jgi:hypothetical protein
LDGEKPEAAAGLDKSAAETSEAVQPFGNMSAFFAKLAPPASRVIDSTFRGYSETEIERIIDNPQSNQTSLIELSNYLYSSNGYYQKIISYYANMAMFRWKIDVIAKNDSFYGVKPEQLRKNFCKAANIADRLKLDLEINRIIRTLFVEDAVFGYVSAAGGVDRIFYLPARWCAIRETINNVFIYGVNRRALAERDLAALPEEMRNEIAAAEEDGDGYVYFPPEKTFCLKYNDSRPYLFPPLFNLINGLMEIDAYRRLARANAELNNNKFINFKIPVDKTRQNTFLLTDKFVWPFVNRAQVAAEGFGVIVSPMDVELLSVPANSINDRDRLSEAIESLYSEAGVSRSLFSDATSGGEMERGMLVDQTDVFRLYRGIEAWINLRLELFGVADYPAYSFFFKMLDVTSHNEKAFVDQQLKLASASLPNKMTLAAAAGKNPLNIVGDEYLENVVYGRDNLPLGETWTTLKTSYTQSGTPDEEEPNGRPTNASKGLEVDKTTERTIENEGNDPDNRT